MDERRHDRRRRIGVPRGLLRHLSFQFLKEEPMSGSEIVDKIEEYTDWRPSPGSIYPLLSHLQEMGFIRFHENQDSTLKRFELTDMGRERVDELMIQKDQMRARNRNIRKMYWKLYAKMTEELYNSLRDLLDALEDVYSENKGNQEVSDKLKAVLNSAVATIKEIGS
jgi:DNA-binding PadR family transcriptional regulator